jgi:hypothetical protein
MAPPTGPEEMAAPTDTAAKTVATSALPTAPEEMAFHLHIMLP